MFTETHVQIVGRTGLINLDPATSLGEGNILNLNLLNLLSHPSRTNGLLGKYIDGLECAQDKKFSRLSRIFRHHAQTIQKSKSTSSSRVLIFFLHRFLF